MSRHPDFAWFSNWTDRFPQVPQLAVLSRLDRVDGDGARQRVRGWPKPGETYRIWDRCFPGFSTADRDWGAADAHPEGVALLRQVVAAHMRWHGRPRLLTKYTGWPRIAFVRAALPTATFVRVERDPRAVIHSYMERRWWMRARSDEYNAMTVADRLRFYAQRFERFATAGDAYAPEDHIQVRYEDLVSSKDAVLDDLRGRLGLRPDARFARRLAALVVHPGTNDAWRSQLSAADARLLTGLLEPRMRVLGYAPD